MNDRLKLDRFDLRILCQLQKNGRISNVDLVDAVGLSQSYQELVERLLERNIGIEKYFSYIVIKSPFIKAHYPIEHLLSPGP